MRRVLHEAKPLFDGCLAEANRTLTEGSPKLADSYLPVALEKQALRQSQEDSRVRTAIGEWRSCMKAEGHDFADPWAPYVHWSQNRRVPPERKKDPRAGLTSAEVDMALTDVRCKNQTHLLDTWVAATIAYQRQLIDENIDQLRVHQRAVGVNVANAERVLNES